jgi:indolepyruvate ferredoxin oxidoreductase beta subunit
VKKDIILTGVGGQGILSIAAIIDLAALSEKLYIKQAEVHGMSQRGGAVQSHLRISSRPIFSDLIPEGEADIILSVEPLEALRYIDFLSPAGMVISSLTPFKNITDYPAMNDILRMYNNIKNKILIDADMLAQKAGNSKASNIVMLGAASGFMEIPESSFINSISEIFSKKGKEIVNLNLKAFELGLEEARS